MSAGIKSLTIKGFKGFDNEITIGFPIKGKNLVIYGENGSGKTSIMEALKVLLDSSMDKIELEKYKNIFTRRLYKNKYVRLEFERLVTNYAEKKSLEIRFKRKISEIPIDVIWTKVKQNFGESETLCKRIDTYKSILLNSSVHYDQRPKYRNEVKYAIDVVSKLKEEISKELK